MGLAPLELQVPSLSLLAVIPESSTNYLALSSGTRSSPVAKVNDAKAWEWTSWTRL